MSKEQVFDRSKYISGIDPYDKKETLEEASERILANNIDGLKDALKDDDLFYFYKGVIQSYGQAMAKWQQEQMEKLKDFDTWKEWKNKTK